MHRTKAGVSVLEYYYRVSVCSETASFIFSLYFPPGYSPAVLLLAPLMEPPHQGLYGWGAGCAPQSADVLPHLFPRCSWFLLPSPHSRATPLGMALSSHFSRESWQCPGREFSIVETSKIQARKKLAGEFFQGWELGCENGRRSWGPSCLPPMIGKNFVYLFIFNLI